MKKLGIIRLVILVVIMTILGSSSAFAVDTSKENTVVVQLEHCKIAYLCSNQYYGSRPLIIFIPGSNECTSIQKTVNWIRSYELYDDLDCDVIAFAMNSSSIWYRDWEDACEDVIAFISPYCMRLTDDEQFPIIIDAVSFGGYGGVYFVTCGKVNGIFVDELNLADACGVGMDAELVREAITLGTHVNIFASSGSGDISRKTRNVTSELYGMPNFYGIDFPSPHGAVLHNAIFEHDLHSEYAYEYTYYDADDE